MHLSKLAFGPSASFGHRFVMMLVHSIRPMSWKHWPMSLNSNWPLSFCASNSQVKIFDLKSGIVYARKYSASIWAWLGVTWPVIPLAPLSKEILIWLVVSDPLWLGCLVSYQHPKTSIKDTSWSGVYFCALTRSDIITIFTFLVSYNALV